MLTQGQSRVRSVLARATKGTSGFIAVAAVLATVGAVPAGARDRNPATQSVAVRHVDLHPKTDRAARRLVARLDRAAQEACGVSGFSLDALKRSVRHTQCWRDAMDRALDSIRDPRIAAAYERYRPL